MEYSELAGMNIVYTYSQYGTNTDGKRCLRRGYHEPQRTVDQAWKSASLMGVNLEVEAAAALGCTLRCASVGEGF